MADLPYTHMVAKNRLPANGRLGLITRPLLVDIHWLDEIKRSRLCRRWVNKKRDQPEGVCELCSRYSLDRRYYAGALHKKEFWLAELPMEFVRDFDAELVPGRTITVEKRTDGLLRWQVTELYEIRLPSFDLLANLCRLMRFVEQPAGQELRLLEFPEETPGRRQAEGG